MFKAGGWVGLTLHVLMTTPLILWVYWPVWKAAESPQGSTHQHTCLAKNQGLTSTVVISSVIGEKTPSHTTSYRGSKCSLRKSPAHISEVAGSYQKIQGHRQMQAERIKRSVVNQKPLPHKGTYAYDCIALSSQPHPNTTGNKTRCAGVQRVQTTRFYTLFYASDMHCQAKGQDERASTGECVCTKWRVSCWFPLVKEVLASATALFDGYLRIIQGHVLCGSTATGT